MATDATGTPTTNYSIPKFNVNVDAPSGLGGNAQMDAIDTLLLNKVDKPTGLTTGDVPVWNGSAWVRPTGTASSSVFLRGDGSWQTIPGQEVTYTEKTSNTSTAVTTSATAVTIVASPTFTADGTSKYKIDFFCEGFSNTVGTNALICELWDDIAASCIGQLVAFNAIAGASNYGGGTFSREFTPAAGTRQYSVRVWVTGGTGTINAGAGGGTGINVPAFIRITKAT